MKHRQRAQVAIEYVIVIALIGVALFAGPDNVIEQLVRAAHGYYGRFTYALSMP